MKTHYSKEKILGIRKDIVKAAEKQFKKYGYESISFLSISKTTDLSRPSFYNYFSSKEEIFLDVLLREYVSFGGQLEKKFSKEKFDKKAFAEKLTDLVMENLYLARLVSSYENLIEENSRVERLTEYRQNWNEGFYVPFMNVLSFQFSEASEETKESFIDLFLMLLHGAYSIICPCDNMADAMEAANQTKAIDKEAFVARVLELLMLNID